MLLGEINKRSNFLKKLTLTIFSLCISTLCYAGQLNDTFEDTDAMFNYALGILNEYDEDTALNIARYANDLLSDAKKTTDLNEKFEVAMSAWFASVYADMKNSETFPISERDKLQKQINLCVIKAANILGINLHDRKYRSKTEEFLKGKLPDRCGINKGSIPIIRDINMIILDDGIGNQNTFYYHSKNNDDSVDCGKISGDLCFKKLYTIPVTDTLRKAGAKGDTMIFIGECVAPN